MFLYQCCERFQSAMRTYLDRRLRHTRQLCRLLDSGELSADLLPANTHATAPVNFPTGRSEIGNPSMQWRTDKTIPGGDRDLITGERFDNTFPYLPDMGRRLPPGE